MRGYRHRQPSSHGRHAAPPPAFCQTPVPRWVTSRRQREAMTVTHTVSHLVLRDCSTCGEQRAFEALVCADGHGGDCPELACIDCGEAVVVAILDFDVATKAETPLPVAVAA